MDSRFITRLGLHGFGSLALPLICALILNASFLLVGRHGSAKTTLARRLARALGLPFRLFDASKTPFEDVLGFIDPSSLAEGAARYVPTPLSALGAGFVFIDEVSRAEPTMQSKFLELVFERTLMGLPLPALRYVGAGMNPSSYLGAGAVDEALLGRFDIVLTAPTFCTLTLADQRAALEDGAGLNTDGDFDPDGDAEEPSYQPDLVTFIEAARQALPAAQRRVRRHVLAYVLAYVRASKGDGMELDGRRAVMLVRNLVAAHAALDAGWRWDGDDEALYRLIVEASLPFIASDSDFDVGRVWSAHAVAWGTAAGQGESGPGVIDVLGDGDSGRALLLYLEIASTLDETDHDRVVHRFQEELRQAPYQARTAPALRLVELLHAVQDHHEDFPPELVARLLAWGVEFLGVDREQGNALSEMAKAAGGVLDLSKPEDALLARLALRLSSARPDDPSEAPAPIQATRNLNSLRAGLRHAQANGLAR